MTVSELFTGDDGRLRSGWRFGMFVATFIPLWMVLAVLAITISRPIGMEPVQSNSGFLIIYYLFSLTAVLTAGWFCGKHLERLPFRVLGAAFTRGWIKHLVLGLLIGAATIALAIGIPAAIGGLSFETSSADRSSIARTLVVSFLVFLFSAAFEETLFRGYPMQTFFRSGLALFGVLITSLCFAAVHQNENANLLSWSNTFIAGIWFALAYWKTRNLWMPFGMHLMWNWMQGAVFGVEVSGVTNITSSPLLKEIDNGPAWLTGEGYGVEAGVACTAALVISTAVVYFLPVKPDYETAALSTMPVPSPTN